jgi:hypothetical protein
LTKVSIERLDLGGLARWRIVVAHRLRHLGGLSGARDFDAAFDQCHQVAVLVGLAPDVGAADADGRGADADRTSRGRVFFSLPVVKRKAPATSSAPRKVFSGCRLRECKGEARRFAQLDPAAFGQHQVGARTGPGAHDIAAREFHARGQAAP